MLLATITSPRRGILRRWPARMRLALRSLLARAIRRTGTRYFTHMVEREAGSRDELLTAIADRYFRIDCSCFSPNTERIDNVLELARAYRADAVVQYILQYCHAYNIEAMRVDEALREAGVPALKIETDYSQEDEGQLRTRIEALLESLA